MVISTDLEINSTYKINNTYICNVWAKLRLFWIKIILLFLFLWILMNYSIYAAVFGKDDRNPMLSDGYPWSAIGKIITDQGDCTGSLVGPNLVLTVGHCIYDKNGQPKTNIKFYPNYKNGKGHFYSGVSKVWSGTVKSGWKGRIGDYKVNGRIDYSIIRLKSPLGQKYGWLDWAIETPTILNDVTMVGYSKDFMNGQIAGIQENCRIRGQRLGTFTNDCDAGVGASGGPLLVKHGDRYVIVGVYVAGYEQIFSEFGHQNANLAIKISALSSLLQSLHRNIKYELQTHILLCNKTETKLFSTVAFYDKYWLTKGWMEILPSSCLEVNLENQINNTYYIYTENDFGLDWVGNGKKSFCINNREPFRIKNASKVSCNGKNQVKLNFAGPFTLSEQGLNHRNFLP